MFQRVLAHRYTQVATALFFVAIIGVMAIDPIAAAVERSVLTPLGITWTPFAWAAFAVGAIGLLCGAEPRADVESVYRDGWGVPMLLACAVMCFAGANRVQATYALQIAGEIEEVAPDSSLAWEMRAAHDSVIAMQSLHGHGRFSDVEYGLKALERAAIAAPASEVPEVAAVLETVHREGYLTRAQRILIVQGVVRERSRLAHAGGLADTIARAMR